MQSIILKFDLDCDLPAQHLLVLGAKSSKLAQLTMISLLPTFRNVATPAWLTCCKYRCSSAHKIENTIRRQMSCRCTMPTRAEMDVALAEFLLLLQRLEKRTPMVSSRVQTIQKTAGEEADESGCRLQSFTAETGRTLCYAIRQRIIPWGDCFKTCRWLLVAL